MIFNLTENDFSATVFSGDEKIEMTEMSIEPNEGNDDVYVYLSTPHSNVGISINFTPKEIELFTALLQVAARKVR